MDKAGLDEIRDYTARECLTDSEWAALLSLAYEAVAAQERIDGWKREFEKVQAKRDAYRERAEAAEAEATKLREALQRIAFEDELVYLGCADMPFCHDPHTNTKQCPVAVARAALEGRE